MFCNRLTIKVLLLCALAGSYVMPLSGQLCTIYTEDFEGQECAGLLGPSAPASFTGPGGWVASGGTLTAGSDWFKVVNGVMEARDVDSPVCWTTPEFVNSGDLCYEYFTYSFDASEQGTMESSDYIQSEAIINGVACLGLDEHDDFGSLTYTSVAKNLDCTDPFFVKIQILNSAGPEYHRFDNVEIEVCKAEPTIIGVDGLCVPGPPIGGMMADIGQIAIQAELPACSNGMLEYSIDGGGTWSTLNTFDDVAPGTYTVKVRNSLLPDCCYACSTVTVPSCVVCGFNVACPAATALGPYACDATLPACPTTETAAAAAPYNIDFSANAPCGTIVVTCVDAGVPDLCAGYTITRTITVFDDLNANGVLDAGEESTICVFTLPILPPAGPTITCPTNAIDCSMAPDPIIYIASSYEGVGSDCSDGPDGEYVEICSTEACPGCPFAGTDLSGWTIEDNATNGTSNNSIVITSGTLLPGECLTIYSGMLTVPPSVPNTPSGTLGSPFVIGSVRQSCPIWNNSGDCIFLNNPAGTQIDMECWTANGVVMYPVPVLTGCPTPPMAVTVECAVDFVPGTPTVTTSCGATSTVAVGAPVLISGIADCPAAVYTVTHTVTDQCGNTATCTETFEIANDPPTITCPANAPVDCVANIVAGTPIVVTSCNVSSTIATVGPTFISGTADCPGALYSMVYTVTDACSRTATCTQTLTIANAIPTIICPANTTADCAANIVAGTPLVSTSCTLGSTVTSAGPTLISGIANCPGAIYNMIYTVTDVCSRSASCTQSFTIANAGPTITCPPAMNAACEASIVPGTPSVTTSCGLASTVTTVGPTLVSGTAGALGAVYSIVYTVTDACGRTATCTQLFTISNAAPTISCPANAIVDCAANIVAGTAMTSSSNCTTTGVVTTVGPTFISGTADCPGAIYHIVYTVTDEFGRTASCTQVFTIANAGPTITCPAATVADCSANIVAGTPAVTTSCTLSSTVTTTGPTLATGMADCPSATYNLGYTATDACGRTASCTQIITIANAAPTITCPTAATADCATNIIAGTPVVATSCTLGSSIVVTGPTLTSGVANCPGTTYNLVYTVTDACSRTASCVQVFTIANAAPTITCPANAVVDCSANISAGTPVVTTSCVLGSSVTMTTPVLVMGIADCPGTTYNITYTVTDACSRSASCVQVFTIANAAPTIICPAATVADCSANIVAGTPTVNTSCTLGSSVVVTGPVLATGTAECPGATYTLTYTATDVCGRSATCTQTITLANAAPVITCPANESVNCSSEIVAGVPTIGASCGLGATSSSSGPVLVSGSADCLGAIYDITYTVTDDCGRTTTCVQSFTITNPGPSVTCPENLTTDVCLTQGEINTAFMGWAGTAAIGSVGGPTIDCSSAPDPIIYIASSDNGDNAADECVIGGEYVEICATEGCPGCPEVTTDLSGWEIEDAASVDGSPATTIIITSGSLMPGECVTIYSGYLSGDIPGNPTGTEGSAFVIDSDRVSLGGSCQVWNNSSDVIYLFDGNSQGGGALVDQESYSADGVITYVVPTLTGCPTPTAGGSGFPGCNPVLTNNSLVIGAPATCIGGESTVTFTVTDNCSSVSCIATFIVPPSPAPAIECPPDLTTDICLSQAEIDAAFMGWLSAGGIGGACALAPDPIIYIASSFEGVGTDCTDGPNGEYVEICSTEACPGCTSTGTDLSGWVIEDSFTNGSTNHSIVITSGTLLPGECLTIYSGMLTNPPTVPANTMGSLGSPFVIGSVRQACTIWNNSGDDIAMYDGPGGSLVDFESWSANGVIMYSVPMLTGCPTSMGDALGCNPVFSNNAGPAPQECDGGTELVTFTVTDDCTSVSCDASFTVPEDEDPIAVCADITVAMDDDCLAMIEPMQLDGGSTDDCGPLTFFASRDIFTCLDLMSGELGCATDIPVTLLVRDDCGHTSTCVSTVTLVDDTAPLLVCNDFTISLDGNGEREIWIKQLAEATDNCTAMPVAPMGGTGSGTGSGTPGGGVGTGTGICLSEITLEPSRPLFFTCADLMSGGEFCSNEIPVTITATDDCENTSECTVNITIQDNLPPVIFCPVDKTITLAPGLCGDFNTQPAPIVTDNCGYTLTASADPGFISVECDPDCEGPASSPPTTYSYVAEDFCGNVTTCSYTVTLQEYETTSNALNCNDHIYVTANLDCTVDLQPELILEGDYGCYSCFDVTLEEWHTETALASYTMTVTDPCTGASCWGNVTVEDKTDPVLTGCGDCSDPLVSSPDCIFNCTEEELFTTLNKDNGVIGYDEGLIDDLIPSDPDDFMLDFVGEACGAPMTASYTDLVAKPVACGDPSIMTRTWTVLFTRPDGSTGSLSCEQYYAFKPLISGKADEFGDLAGYEAPHDTIFPGFYLPIPVEDTLLMPKKVVEIPQCGVAIDPASIAAYFDSVLTSDRDSDDDNVDPDEFDIDCVIEANEGFWFAYPHYYIVGLGPDGIDGEFQDDLHAQAVTEEVCNSLVGYVDTPLEACAPGCSGNQKTLRTWTVLDWCTSEYYDYQQVIKIIDEVAPRLEVGPITWSVDPWDCTADVHLPHPEHLSDACDNGLTYSIGFVEGALTVSGNATDGYILHGAKLGTTAVQYVAQDCCGNQRKVTTTVTVVDDTPPVPVTIQNIVVEMTSIINPDQNISGAAKLYVEDVDNGSYDSCTEVLIDLRRNDTCHPDDAEWGPFVTFCCEDLGGAEFALIDVEMRVRDWEGNETIIGSTVRLEDKNGGAGSCPPDIVIECTEDIWNFDVTGGIPRAFTTCEEVNITVDTLQVYEDTEPRRKNANQGGPSLGLYFGRRVEAFDPSCGFGAWRRDFEGGCQQWIVVEPESGVTLDNEDRYVYFSGFDPSTINFPGDVTVDCDGYDTGEPTWIESNCNLVGHTLEVEEFSFEADACLKIVNHWTVIDWCAYDPTDPDLNPIVDAFDPDGDGIPNLTDDDDDGNGQIDGVPYDSDDDGTLDAIDPDLFDRYLEDSGEVEGRYQHTQVIKVFDTEAPVVTSDADLCFATTEDCGSKGVTVSAIGVDNGDCSSEWISWDVDVDMFNDWAVDLTYSSSYNPVLPSGEPNPNYLAKSTNGEAVTIAIPDGTRGSKSLHRVEWRANDGCGNASSLTTYFTIEDKKAPTPYCLNLGTAVMSNGTVELWAIDFDSGSFDNCNESDELLFTFTDVPPPPRCDAEYDSNRDLMWYNTTYWFYDSSEIDDGVQECGTTGAGEYSDGGFNQNTGVFEDYVEGGDIHRWEPGLRSSGKVFTRADITATGFLDIPIYVWDGCQNIDFCTVNLRIIDNDGGAGIVAGTVSTETGQRVDGVEAHLMSNSPTYPKTDMTATDGRFEFIDNEMSRDYEVSGTKDGDDGNGVSTIDLVKIQRHILGIEKFTSPYKVIAADVNGDGKINGVDLVEMRKLILGNYSEFPESDSWRMVDANQLLDIDSPWNYSERITIANLDTDMMSEDFIGVKVGDVDDDVTLGSKSEEEKNKFIELSTTLSEVNGKEFLLTFSTEESLGGYQFTLELGNKEIVAVEGLEENRWAIHGDKLTVSENVSQAEGGQRTGVLFSLRLRSNDRAAVGAVELSSQITKVEAYVGTDLEKVGLTLEGESVEFSLRQNEPNPFRTETVIGYVLPEAGLVKLTLLDVTGQILKEVKVDGSRGDNEIKLDLSGMKGGVIYYRLEAGDNVATRHMIVIE